MESNEFDFTPWDATNELLRPALPPIVSVDDIENATINAGKLYVLVQENAARILELEEQITREQEAVACIRGENYEPLRIAAGSHGYLCRT